MGLASRELEVQRLTQATALATRAELTLRACGERSGCAMCSVFASESEARACGDQPV